MDQVLSVEPDLDFELVYDDGEPLESNWQRNEMNLLIDVTQRAMAERGREGGFAGGNMFIYYSREQARAIAKEAAAGKRLFRGPDFFFVGGVDRHDRKAWVVWDEGGRYPEVIAEFLSPSTAVVDRTTKKTIYEQIFRTPEYFLYDPDGDVLEGFRLSEGAYQPILPDADGRLESRVLDLRLGRWTGQRMTIDAVWLRFYDAGGRMIPTAEEAERERADAERERADAERQRADAAEAEVRRLRALLENRTE